MSTISLNGRTEYKGMIRSLYSFLKSTDLDEVIVRTTHVHGGWHDNEFDAQSAGFNICRVQVQEMIDRHEFAECYYLKRA